MLNIEEWRPTRGHVLARPDEPVQKVGDIYIGRDVNNLDDEGNVLECTVLSVGDPVLTRKGVEEPWDIKPGDRILRRRMAGQRICDETGQRVAVVLCRDDILARID